MSDQQQDEAQSAQTQSNPAASRPALRVVRGKASAEDIAAIVAILAAADGGEDGSSMGRRLFGWAWRAPRMRSAHPRGPGAWRSTTQPR